MGLAAVLLGTLWKSPDSKLCPHDGWALGPSATASSGDGRVEWKASSGPFP